MQYRVKSKAIIYELLDEEAILANLDSGVYYSIRESGTILWRLLLGGYHLSSIVALFNEKYGIDITSDLQAFVHRLLEEELIVEEPSEPSLPSPIDWPAAFIPPKFEKYEEMKDLLMLDPIHEVDEQGWPARST